MSRNFPDWLEAFVAYGSYTEAPKIMHFWGGVSAIAGALRRKVWFEQVYFKWFPSFYIVFVAPPGIVSKSTTADIAMDLLREVPGIKFGPDAVTWQALVSAFSAASEGFVYKDTQYPMSPLTLVASEFGNLVNFQDKEMINLLITLWDGRLRYDKITKMSGNDTIEAPWINLLACTTPHWIADNMSKYTIGGGFTSRCIFLYAEEKEQFVAYLEDFVPETIAETRRKLVQDLEHISVNLTGPFTLQPAAKEWGRDWYKRLWEHEYRSSDPDWKSGYHSRKQTHLHKLAMVISAARRDTLVITEKDMRLADIMLTETEKNSAKVFEKIGVSEDAGNAEIVAEYIRRKGEAPYEEVYQEVLRYFPKFTDWDNILTGLLRAGQVQVLQKGTMQMLKWVGVDKHPGR